MKDGFFQPTNNAHHVGGFKEVDFNKIEGGKVSDYSVTS